MNHRHIESFLLKIVIEDQSTDLSPDVRGRVQHIGTGQAYQFNHMQDLVTYLQQQFGNDKISVQSNPQLPSL